LQGKNDAQEKMGLWAGNFFQPHSHILHILILKRQRMGFAGVYIKVVPNNSWQLDCRVIGNHPFCHHYFFAGIPVCNAEASWIQEKA
jgi:hypothetical protein